MGFTTGGPRGVGVITSPFTPKSDLTDVLAEVAARGGHLGGITETERDAISGAALFEGLTCYNLTKDTTEVYDGTGWVVIGARIRGRVNRSNTATTFPGSYTNVAADSFWTANVAKGVAPYSNGWTIPITGRYMVSYEVRATGSFLAGVSTNYALGSPTLDFMASAPTVQTIAATTVTGSKKYTAGDVLRLYLLADSGTPAWTVGVGFFSIEWVGSD